MDDIGLEKIRTQMCAIVHCRKSGDRCYL